MKMESAKSSNIDSVGYDEEKRELHVKFKRGATYAYHDVPADVVKAFRAVEFSGKYLNQHVKPKFKVHRCVIGADPATVLKAMQANGEGFVVHEGDGQ
jgi:hypothetical protein